jgi:hypothetical protein
MANDGYRRSWEGEHIGLGVNTVHHYSENNGACTGMEWVVSERVRLTSGKPGSPQHDRIVFIHHTVEEARRIARDLLEWADQAESRSNV